MLGPRRLATAADSGPDRAARRCGASSSQVATGHSSASNSGASSSSQPGNMPPASMRTISDTRCAARNSGRICTACDGTGEPQQPAVRRVIAKKLSSV